MCRFRPLNNLEISKKGKVAIELNEDKKSLKLNVNNFILIFLSNQNIMYYIY